MSEQRQRERRLAVKVGTKTTKIELFPASEWRYLWEPGSNKFFPKVPLQTQKRQEYFSERYRVRLDDSWVVEGAQYRMFTREEIVERWIF